jgi:hypothetical protein
LRFAYRAALTLPPGARRLRRRSRRLFAHALISHPGEEQDLCAAVTRSRATGTVRGPETDDIVHDGPLENRSIVAIRSHCRRAKVNKWSTGGVSGLPFQATDRDAANAVYSAQIPARLF